MKINKEVVKTFKPKAGDIVESRNGELYIIGVDIHKKFRLINLKSGYVTQEAYPTVDDLVKHYLRYVTYYDNNEAELNLGGGHK